MHSKVNTFVEICELLVRVPLRCLPLVDFEPIQPACETMDAIVNGNGTGGSHDSFVDETTRTCATQAATEMFSPVFLAPSDRAK